MASVADTAAPWADPDDPVSPELALVDPDLARRLRSRETARPAPPVRPSGASSLLPVLAFQREVRSTAEPAPDPDAVRAAFHAPPRPAGDAAPVPSGAPVGVRERARTQAGPTAAPAVARPSAAPTTTSAARRPVRGRILRALWVVAVALGVTLALLVAVVYALERLAAPSGAPAAATTSATPPASAPPVRPTLPGVASPTHPSSAAQASAAGRLPLVRAQGEVRRPAGGVSLETTALASVSLSWPRVEDARAYRFELVRDGARQFVSLTPTPSFVVPVVWTYAGRPGRLRPGVYRWRVWPLDATGRADDPPLLESRLLVG